MISRVAMAKLKRISETLSEQEESFRGKNEAKKLFIDAVDVEVAVVINA